MNNLSSYYGLTDSNMSASEKDLPVSGNLNYFRHLTTFSNKPFEWNGRILMQFDGGNKWKLSQG